MTLKSLDFYVCVMILSPALIDTPLKSHFGCGDLNTINYVFINLLVIIHLLIPASQLFDFVIASNDCLHLNYLFI